MRTIKLTKGYETIVDDEDFKLVSKRTWHYEHGYARSVYPTKVYMHSLIMNTPKGMMTDHVNRNGLDNRRSNLRVCEQLQNSANRALNKNNTSGYKGVGWHKQAKKWRAHIDIKGKHFSLGLYDSQIEAVMAYNRAAVEHFGEYAWLNKI